jgi:hypothetical protein
MTWCSVEKRYIDNYISCYQLRPHWILIGSRQNERVGRDRRKTLIVWQQDLLKDVDNVRIVVSFQAEDVISEIMKLRNVVLSVCTHNYDDTRTGASCYLETKDANEHVIDYDSDLCNHLDDLKVCLE